ncbi:MAG TPA: HAMP domain-containing sensor histidine kinase [Niabella sp.]|uniref:histidine kinase n=1 Tax=Chryseobacterium indologenes TaxID=253 RepID=A0AAD0YU87_CHRID|nr:HAMP domain-containing sensor histidine kinase [Chryseobacterium indologenes]AZB17252.1 sensor histidine kinase [Chryseobacterium indologenes]HMR81760.1 HAMP domain-containing sensor histidine kinase [Niabella sp.]
MSNPLLQRHTKSLLIWLPLILIISSSIFYFVLKGHAHHAEEKYLLLKQQNVWNSFIATSGSLERHITGEYSIEEKNTSSEVVLNIPKDTVLFYEMEGKQLPFKVLTKEYQWKNGSYLVSTYISATETAHLIAKVFVSEAIILLVLLITIVIVSRKSSVRLWQPFFSSINAAEKFDLNRNNELKLPTLTGTTEFDRLNESLNKLVENVNTAYRNQKQFVENASHESQTPLAIIRAKLELLINHPNIDEKEALLLGDITNATNRLSEMNKTLLLLAKIENNQFPETESINVNDVVQEISENCATYIDDCPNMTSTVIDPIMVTANRTLIEILISNIINNAIVHNNDKKEVSINIQGNKVKIENTGNPLLVDPEVLFERFRKNTYQKNTTGLGLALVKQICQLYGYTIAYNYKNGWHSVEICFS